MRMSSLAERQRAFAAALFSETVPECLTARRPAEAAHRFGVYRNNVTTGLVEALRRRFPVVERIVGEEFFAAAARCFIAVHPPRSPLLFAYGAEFPRFLAGFPPAAELAYLADVAALEVSLGEAYHAADAVPLTPGDLARYANADPERLYLRLHPALCLVASPHPIVRIWRMNRQDAVPGPIADWRGETALVARPDDVVALRACDPGEATFVGALAQGAELARAAGAAWADDPAFTLPQALARLIEDRLVVAITTDTPRPTRELCP
jgi:hypothetical protein